MAGAGYKLFNTGDVLTAAQVNTYLMEQTVMVFADAAARTTALTGVVSEGMISYLKDTNAVEVYDGSNWVSSDDPNAIQNTIVDAKGDLITATAADTPARLAVGNDGETLVADSSATTGLRWQGDYAAGKNKIINGDFGIWQRGTSFTSLTDAYTADRWKVESNRTSSAVSRQTFTPASAPVAGYEGTYFLRYTAGTSGNYSSLLTRLEDVRLFANQTVTLSYWAKCSSGTITNEPYLFQNFGSGGSSEVQTALATSTITTSWQRFSQTFTVPSISGKTIGTSSYVALLLIRPSAGTSESVDVWGVQLEAGSVATAFQTATGTLAGELAACQRYYLTSQRTQALEPLGVGQAYSTTQGVYTTFLPVQMRNTPTISYVGTASDFVITNGTDGSIAATAVAINSGVLGNKTFRTLVTVASGLTAGQGSSWLHANNTNSAYWEASAEL